MKWKQHYYLNRKWVWYFQLQRVWWSMSDSRKGKESLLKAVEVCWVLIKTRMIPAITNRCFFQGIQKFSFAKLWKRLSYCRRLIVSTLYFFFYFPFVSFKTKTRHKHVLEVELGLVHEYRYFCQSYFLFFASVACCNRYCPIVKSC